MKTLIAAGAMALMASASYAQDWTGGYVGLGIGYADIPDISAPGGGPSIPGGNEYTYGIHAGYSYDFGQWVAAGELEYDRVDISIANGAVNVDDVVRLKASVGYDFGPAVSYVIVGGARANTSGLGNDTGYLYGIGAAYRITPQWVLSGEVLQHKFDDFNGSGLDVEANTFNVRASFRF